jgi:hypothetical protein
MEFPRSFKQLKEFGDGRKFDLIGNDADHSSRERLESGQSREVR